MTRLFDVGALSKVLSDWYDHWELDKPHGEGEAVSIEALNGVIDLFASLFIVPTNEGGVQVEATNSVNGFEIEIEFDANGRVKAVLLVTDASWRTDEEVHNNELYVEVTKD